MNNEKMSKLISQSRKEKRLTQKELANQLGVTDKAVSKWERGLSYPDISLLSKLSEVLGVSVNDLVQGEKTQSDADDSTPKISLRNSERNNKVSNRKMIVTGLGIIPFICIILFLSISAIGMGLSWVLIPVSIIAVLWLVSIIGPFVMNKYNIASGMFCGALIFTATYYYALLNQATTRDIARYGEFSGPQRAYIPHYTIIIIMLLVSLIISLLSTAILKKSLSGDTMFLLGAGSITLIMIAVLTVSSIMDYVDIHGLSVNPMFTILLLITCLMNCLSLVILIRRHLKKTIL